MCYSAPDNIQSASQHQKKSQEIHTHVHVLGLMLFVVVVFPLSNLQANHDTTTTTTTTAKRGWGGMSLYKEPRCVAMLTSVPLLFCDQVHNYKYTNLNFLARRSPTSCDRRRSASALPRTSEKRLSERELQRVVRRLRKPTLSYEISR